MEMKTNDNRCFGDSSLCNVIRRALGGVWPEGQQDDPVAQSEALAAGGSCSVSAVDVRDGVSCVLPTL